MTERTDEGVDERPALKHRHEAVLERFKAADPLGYEVLFGETVGLVTTQDYASTIAHWRERAETAERALLGVWWDVGDGGNKPWVGYCRLCDDATYGEQASYQHAPACIIPALLERYET